MNLFRHNEDKDMFLQIVNKTAMIHKVVVLTNQIKDKFGAYLEITFLVIFLMTDSICSLLEYKKHMEIMR